MKLKALREKAIAGMKSLPEGNTARRAELQRIAEGLNHIRTEKPVSFHEALQLLWLYALLAGVINYGRLDDFRTTAVGVHSSRRSAAAPASRAWSSTKV